MTAQDYAPRYYRGLKIKPLAYGPTVNCTVTLPDNGEKVVLTGKLCFERHEDSYKYEDEVIINVWSKAPSKIKEALVQDGTWRLEVPVKIDDFYYTICQCKRELEDYFRGKKRK